MKKLLLTVVALGIGTMALSACGGSAKNQALAKCDEEAGTEAEMCACFINGIDENVDADIAEAMFEAMVADDGSTDDLMSTVDLSMTEKMALATTMMEVGQSCMGDSLFGE